MIIWDAEKNKKLKKERNISFEEVVNIIENQDYITIKRNPNKKRQKIFILELNNYIHVVPFVIDKNYNIVLKTIFPSRKFNKIYGGEEK